MFTQGQTNVATPANQEFLRNLLGGAGGEGLFGGGAGGAGAGAGAAAGGLGGAGGIGALISALRSALGGVVGGGADLLSSILGGRQVQKGFGDLESQLQQALGGQQSFLGGLQPFEQAGRSAATQELGMLQAGADPTAQVNKILGAFAQSPAQKATIEAGLSAVQNRLQAQGLGQSGAQQKALEQFAQTGTAGQQQQFLQNVLGARQQTLGGLGGLGQLGIDAEQLGLRGQEDISSLLESLGQTQLGAAGAGAGKTSGIIGSIASMLQSIL